MASYAPTITVLSTPGISASMPGTLTYQEFIQSLGQYAYWIKQYYLGAGSSQQLLQPMYYTHNDATGESTSEVMINALDPYQAESTIVMDMRDRSLILDGNSSISFTLMQGQQLLISMLVRQEALFGEINNISPSNYSRADDELGQLELYKDYTDTL